MFFYIICVYANCFAGSPLPERRSNTPVILFPFDIPVNGFTSFQQFIWFYFIKCIIREVRYRLTDPELASVERLRARGAVPAVCAGVSADSWKSLFSWSSTKTICASLLCQYRALNNFQYLFLASGVWWAYNRVYEDWTYIHQADGPSAHHLNGRPVAPRGQTRRESRMFVVKSAKAIKLDNHKTAAL